MSSTLNLSTLLSSPKEQPFYVGLTGFVYGSGCVLGPIVGGALADSAATWRWVSYHVTSVAQGQLSYRVNELTILPGFLP
jgi:MFS family permease